MIAARHFATVSVAPRFLAIMLVLISASPSEAAVYNLHLVTDNGPDYTNIESFVRTVTAECKTPQEKCIAIWKWGRRGRRQTSCAHEDGRLIWDPILHYNSYGTMNCGVISALNIASFLQLGYQARYVQLGDHTVSEVSWDDGRSWHMFDSSMSFFCFNHAGEVASCQEILESHGCALSGGTSQPGHFYLYHGAPQCVSHVGPDGWRCASDQPVAYHRTLINGASSYTDGFSVSQYTQYARFGRRYTLNLRPHESYTRHWYPLDRQHSELLSADRVDYYRPLNGRDPNEQHKLFNVRGNGIWVFQPDFTDTDCRKLFYDDENIEIDVSKRTGPHLHPVRHGQPASFVLKVAGANVITSMQLEAVGLRSPEDMLRISVCRTAGIRWVPVWQSEQTGPQKIELRLRDEVAGVTECLVKVEMAAAHNKTDVGLDRLQLTTITQLNRRTLPKLTRGTNRVQLFSDEQLESTLLWPPLHSGRYRETIFAEQDIHSADEPDGCYKATLGAGSDRRECQVVWRLKTPSAISDVAFGVVATNRSPSSYVSLQHSFDGQDYTEFYRDSDGGFPFDQQVLNTIAGPTNEAPSSQAYLKCVFFNQRGGGTYNMAGIQDLFIRVTHTPRDAHFQPIEVTYNWTEYREAGEITRSHTELVQTLPYEYVINTGGLRDPTMNWVRMNLQGSGPSGEKGTYGYADGEDVGPDLEPGQVTYAWENNLAIFKPYTASRPSSIESHNPDSDGRELTNGVIIAPTDLATADEVQPATAFWSTDKPIVLVVDLGVAKQVAGVRLSSHQPNADYGHPECVEVAVSTDGNDWLTAGTISHDDLWNPPVDYEPWEHDDDPSYSHLRAGGRLAYSYPLPFDVPLAARYLRFSCVPAPGQGVGLSELQAFEQVTVTPWNGARAAE